MDLELALWDLYLYRLRRVGRKNMSSQQLWEGWLRAE